MRKITKSTTSAKSGVNILLRSVPEQTHALIKGAAAFTSETLHDFVVSAALDRARHVIKECQ